MEKIKARIEADRDRRRRRTERLAVLEQENAKLREALRKIADDAEYNWLFGISNEARAALTRAAPRPEET